jgi:hypothetical protein
VIVATQSGILELDARTGERIATGCGWRFGLSTTEPARSAFDSPTLCEEAP